MSPHDEVRKHQRAFLEELKTKTEPYVMEVRGIKFTVNPGVFPSATDSRLLADHIRVERGMCILDLTTGSGIFALIAGLQGAIGVAVDRVPAAVQNARENFERFGVKIQAIQSDLFENVPKEKYDFIFANGPYFEGEVTEALEHSFYGARDFVTRLFYQAPVYLKEGGVLLVTFAEWGDIALFEQTARTRGFNLQVLDKRTSDDGQRTYRVYRCTLKK